MIIRNVTTFYYFKWRNYYDGKKGVQEEVLVGNDVQIISLKLLKQLVTNELIEIGVSPRGPLGIYESNSKHGNINERD